MNLAELRTYHVAAQHRARYDAENCESCFLLAEIARVERLLITIQTAPAPAPTLWDRLSELFNPRQRCERKGHVWRYPEIFCRRCGDPSRLSVTEKS